MIEYKLGAINQCPEHILPGFFSIRPFGHRVAHRLALAVGRESPQGTQIQFIRNLVVGPARLERQSTGL